MRQRTRERGARGVRALAQVTERGARQVGERRRERADVGITRMALRDQAEQHEAGLARERRGGRALRVGRLGARDELAHVRRRVGVDRLRGGRDDAGERRGERFERSLDVRGGLEMVRVALGVHERDARALAARPCGCGAR